MNIDFLDKVVVVTGAASGIGLATMSGFGALGAAVYGLDVNGRALRRERSRLRRLNYDVGGIAANYNIHAITANIRRPTQWMPKLPPRIDVLCNVAAIIDPGNPAPDIKAEITLANGPIAGLIAQMANLRAVFEINYRGPYLLSLVAAEKMIGGAPPTLSAPAGASPEAQAEAERKKKTNRRGVIINVGSTNTFTLKNDRPGYAPLKAALHNLTEWMAKGLAPYGIRVNCVAPGGTAGTDIGPDPKSRQPDAPLGINSVDDVVNAILFLASDYASNITGQLLMVDGGRVVYQDECR